MRVVEVQYTIAKTIKHSEANTYNNFPNRAVIIPILYKSLIAQHSMRAKIEWMAIIMRQS